MLKRVLCLLFIGLVVVSSGMVAGARMGVSRNTDGSRVILLPQHFPFLVAALPFVSDPADKAILLSAIQMIKSKGVATTADLEMFAKELGVNRSFFTGNVIAQGDFGNVYFFPRLLYSIWSNHFGAGAFMFMLPAVCSYWEAFDSPEYTQTAWCAINGETVVEGNNSGLFIGGIGGFERDSGEGEGYPYFSYSAAAVLIMVRS